jgi:hypothetical protein
MPTKTVHYNDLRAEGKVWANQDSFTTTLVVLFVDTYGTEGFDWHPNTVEIEVEHDFRINLPDVNFEKLMTGISLFKTNNFYRSLPDFIRSCVVLNGERVGKDQFELADAADCAWGMTEAMLLHPPEVDEPFTAEIRTYVGKMLDQEGILTPPDILRIALRDQDVAEQVRYGFSDDPEMFGAIQDMQAAKTEDINHLIKSRLRSLFHQLKSLPLNAQASDNMAKVVEKVLRSLPGDATPPLPS